MVKIIIKKDSRGVEVDIRRWTPKDCFWMMRPLKRRRFKEILRTLISGVSLCKIGVPTHIKPDDAYATAIREAWRQVQMGTTKRVSIEFR